MPTSIPFSEGFRRASSQVPSGAAVVKVASEEPASCPASGFCVVSFEPAIVAVSVAKSPAALELRRSATFSIEILREGPQDSTDAAVRFFCQAKDFQEYGDHCLVIAAVERFDAPAGRPLVLWCRTAFRLHLNYPFLADSLALDSFIRNWETGALPKPAWTHSAHVAASAYRAFDRSAEETFAAMKHGIIHYNACVGTVDGPDSGYHETLTRFWSQVIAEFTHRGGYASRLDAARASVDEFGEDRDLHRMYYSFDVVRDHRARREWITPDLA